MTRFKSWLTPILIALVIFFGTATPLWVVAQTNDQTDRLIEQIRRTQVAIRATQIEIRQTQLANRETQLANRELLCDIAAATPHIPVPPDCEGG